MIDKINLEYLKIFAEVAKTKNITKASLSLNISQPAITQTINKLENQLNEKLFIRTKRGVKLTEIGTHVYNIALSALTKLKEIDLLLNQNFEYTEIKIGCGTNIAKRILSEPIVKLKNKYSKINLTVYDNTKTNMLKMLEEGELDLVISQKQVNISNNLIFNSLIKEKFVMVCSKTYFNNLKEERDYIVQSVGTYNRFLFENYIVKLNKKINSIIQVAGYTLSIELAKRNLGIAIVPYYLVENELNNKELLTLDDFLESEYVEYGYYINKNNLSNCVKEFIKILK